LQSLREVVDPACKQVVIFGAGGAARAIGVELALAGATRITVVNRGEGRGRTLVDLLNRKTKAETELVVQGGAYKIPTEADIVVNATSIGLYPDIDGRLNLDVESLRPSLIVADVIPNPPRTRLIRDAEARGCRVLDGLGMIVNQGVIGIKYWTGIDVEASVMRKELENLFLN
jgi:shikimate dehydrogenase